MREEMGTIRLYQAESDVTWSPKAAASLNQTQAQHLADKATKWLTATGYTLPRKPHVTMKRGNRSIAYPWTGEIRLAQNRSYQWVVLHEVAHLVDLEPHMLPGWDGEPDTRPHGRAFVAIYLRLVGRFCGQNDRKALAAACKEHGVKYRPRRRRQMTVEAKAAAVARLAASRPAPSPHRFALMRTGLPDRRILWTETARQHGRVDISERFQHGDPMSHGPVFASKATGDYVVFDRAPGSYHSLSIAGTVDRERAVTRATVESIERWAAKNRWLTRSEWTIVDIAASQDV